MAEVRTPRLDETTPTPTPQPGAMTVNHDHKAILYTPNGQAIVRKAGF